MAWMPRSGLDEIDGMVWLPRMIDKARRYIECGESSRRFDGYLYGENDFIDARVLRFLRLSDSAFASIVRENTDDAEAGRVAIAHSGRTPEQCRAFSAKLKRGMHDFALLEADEERMPPGLKRTLIRALYGGIIVPIAYAFFRRDEAKR